MSPKLPSHAGRECRIEGSSFTYTAGKSDWMINDDTNQSEIHVYVEPQGFPHLGQWVALSQIEWLPLTHDEWN